MDSIIEQLQKVTSYKVTEIGAEGSKTNTITNYRAINSKYNEADVVQEIATANLVSSTPASLPTRFLAPLCIPPPSNTPRSPAPWAPTSSSSSRP